MGRKNPIDNVNFYSRHVARDLESVNSAAGSGQHESGELVGGPIRRERVSCFIPPVFQEQSLRLYCRFAADVRAARFAFEKWYALCRVSTRIARVYRMCTRAPAHGGASVSQAWRLITFLFCTCPPPQV